MCQRPLPPLPRRYNGGLFCYFIGDSGSNAASGVGQESGCGGEEEVGVHISARYEFRSNVLYIQSTPISVSYATQFVNEFYEIGGINNCVPGR